MLESKINYAVSCVSSGGLRRGGPNGQDQGPTSRGPALNSEDLF